jgi:hypothetical protein
LASFEQPVTRTTTRATVTILSSIGFSIVVIC